MRERVEQYLHNQQEIPMTFTTNQFKGTPTLVLFNEEHKILASWFGHIRLDAITEKIESMLN